MKTDAIRRITIEGRTTGVNEATASLSALSRAQTSVAQTADGVAVATESSARRQLSAAKAYDSVRQRVDESYRAHVQQQKMLDTVQRAFDQGSISAAEFARTSAQVAESFKKQGKAANDNGSALAGMGAALGQIHPALGLVSAGGLSAAAGIGATALSINQMVTAATALADQAGKLKDFADTTGFSVVQLQALEKAAAQVGVSGDSVGKGLEKFSVAIDDVKKGTGSAYESILEISPGLASQFKQVGSLTEAWDLFSKAIKAADLEQGNKLARSIFGRSGVEITRLARASDEAGGLVGLVGQLKEVDRITAAQADRWDTLGDTIAENAKLAKQNVASIFTEDVLVGAERFTRALLELSRSMKEFTLGEDFKSIVSWSKTWYGQAILAGASGAAGGAAFGGGLGFMAGGVGAVPGAIGGAIIGGATSAIWGAQQATTSKALPPIVVPSPMRDAANNADERVRVKQLEAEKLALAGMIYEQERANAAMGAAVAPADALRLSLSKVQLALLEHKINGDQAAKAQAVLNAQFSEQQFATYASALGGAISATEAVRLKTDQLAAAQRNGARFTDEQVATQRRLAYENALGITQINAAIDAEKVRAMTMRMGAEAALSYEVAQSAINERIRAGREPNAEEIEQIKAKANELARIKIASDRYADVMNTLRGSAISFTSDLVSGLRNGRSMMQALGDAATNLSNRLADKAITSLFSGDFAGAAISGIGAIATGIFGSRSKERERQAQEAKAAAERAEAYAQRAQLARIDTTNEAGALQAFDIQAQKQRIDEWRAGGRGIAALEQALAAERLSIVERFAQEAAAAEEAARKAALQRTAAFQDRLFAAANDNSSLDGALAEYNRKAMQEQAAEIEAGGQAIADLIAAQEAERLAIYRRFGEEAKKTAEAAADAQRKALLSVQQFIDQVGKTIRDFVNNLKTGASSTLSPDRRLAEAQSQFSAQYALAQAGDRTALGTITQYGQTLIEIAKGFYASTGGYTAVFNDVTSKLTAIPDTLTTSQVSSADQIVAAIQESKAGVQASVASTTAAVNVTGAQADALAAAQNALAAQQVTYLQAQNALLGAINSLTDRVVAAINQLGANQAFFGNIHTYWLTYIGKATAQAADKRVWDYLQGGGIVGHFADGGMIGNGVFNRDSVLARYESGGTIALAGGEYVMPANQTQRYLSQLEAMRAGNDNGVRFAAPRMSGYPAAYDDSNMMRLNAAGFSAVVRALQEEMASLRMAVSSVTSAVRENKPRPGRPNERAA